MFGYAAPVLPQKGPSSNPAATPPPTATPQAFPPPVAAPPPAAPAPAPWAPPPAPAAAPFAPPPAAPAPAPWAPPPAPAAAPFAPPPAAPAPAPWAPPPAAPAAAPFAPPPAQPAFSPPPAQPVAQPWAPPPLAAPPPTGPHNTGPSPMASAVGGIAGAASAQVRQGKLLGIPFSLLRDHQFEMKVLMISAIALVVTRFFPILKAGSGEYSTMIWAWKPEGGTFFLTMIWPFLVAAVYGGVVFAPPHIKQKVPPGLLRWAPFFVAFLSTGLLYATVPIAYLVLVGSLGRADMPAGLAMMAWFFPMLVFGLVVRLQNPEDKIAPVMIVLGGLMTFIGGLVANDIVFAMKGMGVIGAFHNVLWIIVVFASLGAVAFAAIPWIPALRPIERFAALATSVFVAWPLASLVLVSLAVGTKDAFVNLILVLPHLLVGLVAFYGVLLLTAPEALDALKGLLNQPMGVPATGAGGAAMAAAPQMVPPHVHQQLLDLDAAWARGGMTPEEYHGRRNAILAQVPR